jgi:hypothetical protein
VQKRFHDDRENDREKKLEEQRKTNVFHRFVDGNLIIKQGFLEKRKVQKFVAHFGIFLLNA